jgi:CheY-like chemotaxis protein
MNSLIKIGAAKMSDQRNPKVLFVDDDSDWHLILRNDLTELGYECDGAYNFVEARSILRKARTLGEAFSVVILDWNLSNTNESVFPQDQGGDILVYLKNKYPHIGRIILSGDDRAKDDHLEEILYDNSRIFIPKQRYKLTMLTAALEKALEIKQKNHSRAADDSYEVSDLSLRRPKDIERLIEARQDLLNKYEQQLRLTNDPRELARYDAEIEQLKSDIESYITIRNRMGNA